MDPIRELATYFSNMILDKKAPSEDSGCPKNIKFEKLLEKKSPEIGLLMNIFFYKGYMTIFGHYFISNIFC